MKAYSVDWIALSTTNIGALQASTNGTPLVFATPVTTANFASGINSVYAAMPFNNVRLVSLTSAGNLSAINYTITGVGSQGQIITEVLAGPNTNTVYSVNAYIQVNSIVPSATSVIQISIGMGGGYTMPFTHDVWNKQSLNSFQIQNVVGTVSVTPQITDDSPYIGQAGSYVPKTQYWASLPITSTNPAITVPLTAASIFAFSQFPVVQSRFLVGNTTTGTFTLVILQQGAKF